MNRLLCKSEKLNQVSYDIRGPILKEVKRLEADKQHITRLNIGNPAAFGLFAPEHMMAGIVNHLDEAHGYCDSNGIEEAREAIVRYYTEKGTQDIGIEDVYTGNGVSELIMLSMQALLNEGDEVLVPAPDYPLWTGAVKLSGGTPVHYLCDEQNGWLPDMEDIQKKVNGNTKAIVVINPNNPTGAVYPEDTLKSIVRVAEQNQIIVYADEIYEKILYDDKKHISIASLTDAVLVVTLSGLSKSHRMAGFRIGWMVLSGSRKMAKDYIEGLSLLSSMRLCSNVPSQYVIKDALEGYQCINDMVKPGGRLLEQRNTVYELLNEIPGVFCTKPEGAFYFFPKLDRTRFHIEDDRKFALDLLLAKKILIVQGTGFHWPDPDHFRIVALLNKDELKEAVFDIGDFLSDYRQKK